MSCFILEKGSKGKLTSIIEKLREEGVEVISFSQRYIQAEEAFLLRSRIVEQKFNVMSKAFNENKRKINKDNEIKQAIQMDPFESNYKGEQNPY